MRRSRRKPSPPNFHRCSPPSRIPDRPAGAPGPTLDIVPAFRTGPVQFDQVTGAVRIARRTDEFEVGGTREIVFDIVGLVVYQVVDIHERVAAFEPAAACSEIHFSVAVVAELCEIFEAVFRFVEFVAAVEIEAVGIRRFYEIRGIRLQFHREFRRIAPDNLCLGSRKLETFVCSDERLADVVGFLDGGRFDQNRLVRHDAGPTFAHIRIVGLIRVLDIVSRGLSRDLHLTVITQVRAPHEFDYAVHTFVEYRGNRLPVVATVEHPETGVFTLFERDEVSFQIGRHRERHLLGRHRETVFPSDGPTGDQFAGSVVEQTGRNGEHAVRHDDFDVHDFARYGRFGDGDGIFLRNGGVDRVLFGLELLDNDS